jgi:hypothetical protein
MHPRHRWHAISTMRLATALAMLLQGCAALPIAAVGGMALQAGGGARVKTGTEYTASGAARRTFTIPLEDVHAAILEALCRADVSVQQDETSKSGQLAIVGEVQHRRIRVRLIPLTRALTSMELVVKRNILASDKATASELVAQTEQVLAEKPMFAPRLDRAADGSPHR